MAGKVLLCDDSMLVRKKLRALVEDCGFVVTEAQNGRQAIEQYAKESPDIVLMDIVMPEMTGLDALAAIRQADHEAKVVMISSTGTSAKLIEALKQGALDFVQKPFEAEQIRDLLTRLMMQNKEDLHV